MFLAILATQTAPTCRTHGYFDETSYVNIWVFPKIGVPQNGWFIVENPIKMDALGGKPTIFGNTHIHVDKTH